MTWLTFNTFCTVQSSVVKSGRHPQIHNRKRGAERIATLVFAVGSWEQWNTPKNKHLALVADQMR